MLGVRVNLLVRFFVMTVELLNIDCMEYMAGCADNAFDLAIVDPPYGIGKALVSGGKKSGGWHRMVESGADKWDIAPNDEYFMQLFRISKDQIIWGGNYFNLPPTKKPLCWDKIRPNQQNVSEWEFAWTSFKGRAEKFNYCANGGFLLKTPRIHPTQKPIQLYKWLLKKFSKKGDRVIDTHSGSGSLAIACNDFHIDAVCCEIDKDYFEASKKRFKRETAQMTMF